MSLCEGNRSRAEINLDNISHNVAEIRRLIGKRTEILGVVKADGYGHGAVQVAAQLIESGVERLAVSMADEAIQLRKHGFVIPILVLGYTDPARADKVIEYDFAQTVYDTDLAEALSAEAVRRGRNVRIHVKIDTGMARVGFMAGFSAVDTVIRISKLPGLVIEGIYTHFASADEEESEFTEIQFDRFMGICNELSRVGVHIPLKHCANSATILRYSHMRLDMVRPGLILYGLYPSEYLKKSGIMLKPAMQIKSDVVMVKKIEPGTTISYGRTFMAKEEMSVATVPIGYADGYLRSLSNRAFMMVSGVRVPVIGRICMDQCMIDVTGIETVCVGDEVVVMGDSASGSVTADELAGIASTVNYEVVSLVGKRLPRYYIKGGKTVKVLNYLI